MNLKKGALACECQEIEMCTFLYAKLILLYQNTLQLQSVTFGAFFLAFIMIEKPSAKMKTGASQSYCYWYILSILRM